MLLFILLLLLLLLLLLGDIAKSIGCSILLVREDGVLDACGRFGICFELLCGISFDFSTRSSGTGVVERESGEELVVDDIDIID